MTYTKTVWVNDGPPPISAGNLGNIETGVYNNDQKLTGAWFNVKDATYGAVGDGTTNDTAAIQAAINAASAAGGGTVLLPVGTYSVTTLSLKSYVRLQGVSRGAVMLKLRNGTDANVLQLSSARQEQVSLRDFTIDGNRGNNSSGHGIYLQNDSNTNGVFASGLGNPHHFIDNLTIQNCKQTGLYMDGDTLGGECHISNVFSYANDQYGFYATTPDCNWDRCVAGQSGGKGFFIQSPNSRYNNCKAWFSGRIDSNDGDGFYLSDGMRQELTGCEAQDNKRHGFVFVNTKYFTATGCIADSNNWTVAGAGFRFDGAVRGYVTGLAYDRQTIPTQKYHVVFANSSESNIVDLSCGPWAAGGGIINGDVGDNVARLHQAVASGASVNQTRGSFVLGSAALATTATSGFLYLPSCAGVPSGVPTTYTGTVPVVVDTTNSKLMVYIGGAWKGITLS